MADFHYIQFTCPSCGQIHSIKIYDGIDVGKNPELKDSVLDAGIFSFKCITCGYETGLTYPFVYYDYKNRFMIEMVEETHTHDPYEKALEGRGANADALRKVYSSMKQNFKFRTVTNPNELIEKILILESGYDDRVLEIMKLYLKSTLAIEKGQEVYGLLFNPSDDCDSFVIETEDGFTGTVAIDQRLYEQIEKEIISVISDEKKQETVISQMWAMQVMQKQRELN